MIEDGKTIKTLVVGNNSEYFSPLALFVPDSQKAEFYRSDIDEADMDILWKGDDKIVLLPEKLDPAFVADISHLLNYRNTHIVNPAQAGQGLCTDILHDPNLYMFVAQSLRQSQQPEVIPWGQTSQFQQLLERLRADGIPFTTPETPPDIALWTADYFDTKVGSRELLSRASKRNPNLKIPEGFTAPNVESALHIAQYFLDANKGVVFKANLGGSGVGVHVFSPDQFTTNIGENKAKMSAKLRENELFNTGPVIIEEYIPPNFRHNGTFPSVDSIVRPDGTVEVQAVDAMDIHRNGETVGFYGCIYGKGLFTTTQAKELQEMSIAVGEELSMLGYRGWYDVDYIFTESGDFFATEANLRRTSICYMLDLAKALFGENAEEHMAMRSNDKYIRPNLKDITYGKLKEILQYLLYPINDTKRGIVITQSFRSMLERGKFGYVSIGADQEDASRIEQEMDKLMQLV